MARVLLVEMEDEFGQIRLRRRVEGFRMCPCGAAMQLCQACGEYFCETCDLTRKYEVYSLKQLCGECLGKPKKPFTAVVPSLNERRVDRIPSRESAPPVLQTWRSQSLVRLTDEQIALLCLMAGLGSPDDVSVFEEFTADEVEALYSSPLWELTGTAFEAL